MQTALEVFRQDKVRAMRLIGFPGLEHFPQSSSVVLAKWGTEKDFLEEYSRVVDNEVRGLKLGSLPISGVTNVAIAATGAWLGGGPVVGATTEWAKSSINDYMLTDPVRLRPTSNEVIYPTALKVVEQIHSEPELGPILADTLRAYGDIGDISMIKKSSEFQSYLQKLQINELQTQYSLLSEGQKTSTERLSYFNKSLSSGLNKLADLQSEHMEITNAILAHQVRTDMGQAERERRRQELEAKRAQIRENIQALQAGFGAAAFIARVSGANANQIRAIQAAGQATDVLYSIMTSTSQNPMVLLGGWFTVATIAISFIESQNQPQDRIPDILAAMQRLAEQIDALRDEMLNQFQRIDSALHFGFLRQESLLNSVIQLQRGQNLEFDKIKITINRARDEIRDLFNAYAERNRKVTWTICLNLERQETEKGRDCAINAFVLAASGAWDAISMAKSLEELFPKTGNLAERGLIRTQSELHRAVPVFAQLRFDQQYQIPNPQVWMWGAGLLSRMFQTFPQLMLLNFGQDWSNITSAGVQIQRFYREAFATPVTGGKYVVDGQVISKQLDRYKSALLIYVSEIGKSLQTVHYPFSNPGQPLPEEYVSEEDNLRTSPAPDSTGDFPQVVNIGSKRLAGKGRGIFHPHEVAKFHPIVVDPLRLCRGEVKPEFEAAKGIQLWEAPFTEVFNEIKANRWFLDATVLPLIPREAIWLERIDPRRFKLSACVSRFFGALREEGNVIGILDSQGKLVPNSADGAFVYTNKMDLIFNLEDANTREAFELGGARMNLSIRVNPKDLELLGTEKSVSIIRKAWDGWSRNSHYGPIRNNIDKYFAPVVTSGVRNDLTAKLEALVESYRDLFTTNAEKDWLVGDVATARSEALLEYQTLKALRFLNYTNSDEVAAMFEIMDQKVSLTAPDQVSSMSLRGVSAEAFYDHITKQALAYKRRVAQLGARILDLPVRTPVDEILAELETLRATMSPPVRNDVRR
jgi:hypothetical protein